jgi:hypothetical protein
MNQIALSNKWVWQLAMLQQLLTMYVLTQTRTITDNVYRHAMYVEKDASQAKWVYWIICGLLALSRNFS